MTFLPIVDRELRVSSRTRSSYISRAQMVLIGTIFFLVLVKEHSLQGGYIVFVSLSELLFISAMLAGLITADTLSAEKREGTLGLLFLTRLRGFDIVLGKMAAGSIKSVFGLFAWLPLLVVPFLLGGVSGGEIFRVAMVSLSFLFFSLSAGICSSSLTRKAGVSYSLMLFILFALCALPSLTVYIIRSGANVSNYPTLLEILKFGPLANCWLAFDLFYAGSRRLFFESLILTHLYAWGLLIFASWRVPSTWRQESDNRSASSKWKLSLPSFSQGSLISRLRRRKSLLDQNAFQWLGIRRRFVTAPLWMALFCGILFYFAVSWLAEYRGIAQFMGLAFALFSAGLVHVFFLMRMASEAAACLGAGCRDESFELLLTTPLSQRDILRGCHLFLINQFGGPLICLLAVDWALCSRYSQNLNHDQLIFISLVFLIGEVVFLVELVVLAMVSLRFSFTSSNARSAARASFIRVALLPAVVFMLLRVFFGFSPASAIDNSIWEALWGFVSLINAYCFARISFVQLCGNSFRLRASGQDHAPDVVETVWRCFSFKAPFAPPLAPVSDRSSS